MANVAEPPRIDMVRVSVENASNVSQRRRPNARARHRRAPAAPRKTCPHLNLDAIFYTDLTEINVAVNFLNMQWEFASIRLCTA